RGLEAARALPPPRGAARRRSPRLRRGSREVPRLSLLDPETRCLRHGDADKGGHRAQRQGGRGTHQPAGAESRHPLRAPRGRGLRPRGRIAAHRLGRTRHRGGCAGRGCLRDAGAAGGARTDRPGRACRAWRGEPAARGGRGAALGLPRRSRAMGRPCRAGEPALDPGDDGDPAARLCLGRDLRTGGGGLAGPLRAEHPAGRWPNMVTEHWTHWMGPVGRLLLAAWIAAVVGVVALSVARTSLASAFHGSYWTMMVGALYSQGPRALVGPVLAIGIVASIDAAQAGSRRARWVIFIVTVAVLMLLAPA